MNGARPVHVTATAVISAVPTTVWSLIVGTLSAGKTIKLHNCAATGDAAAGNLVLQVECDTRGPYDFGNDGAYFDVGCVAVVSGAGPDACVVVG